MKMIHFSALLFGMLIWLSNFASADVKVITHPKDLYATVNHNDLVVVDFSAEYCGLCKYLQPVFERLSDELNSKAVFARAMIDDWDLESKRFNKKFPFDGLPDLLIYQQGKMVYRVDRDAVYLERLKYEKVFKENWYFEGMADYVRKYILSVPSISRTLSVQTRMIGNGSFL